MVLVGYRCRTRYATLTPACPAYIVILVFPNSYVVQEFPAHKPESPEAFLLLDFWCCCDPGHPLFERNISCDYYMKRI